MAASEKLSGKNIAIARSGDQVLLFTTRASTDAELELFQGELSKLRELTGVHFYVIDNISSVIVIKQAEMKHED